MKVEELMIREVQTCSEDCSLSVAAQMMWENDCGALPVTDSYGHVAGMITDRDICMAVFLGQSPWAARLVREVMSREVFTCSAGDEIAAAERTMADKQVRRLPVVDGAGRLVGLLALSNIARECAAEAISVAPREITLGEVVALLDSLSRPRRSRRSAAKAA